MTKCKTWTLLVKSRIRKFEFLSFWSLVNRSGSSDPWSKVTDFSLYHDIALAWLRLNNVEYVLNMIEHLFYFKHGICFMMTSRDDRNIKEWAYVTCVTKVAYLSFCGQYKHSINWSFLFKEILFNLINIKGTIPNEHQPIHVGTFKMTVLWQTFMVRPW